ncbi:unnamed protein product [Peronospora belbahrii]|uniref:Uncharacterized protein n=1 Tax=Peronospora belbahrii TaxID=622444 RepID=A0AAU9L8E1_9STRA|nr:unnamed protein product [Peronospora belbahrii]CAH0518797.1 unnamed protein product [Peronospora belbahrii]
MNIYQQNCLEGLRPNASDELLNSSEILALLDLVIPSDDVSNETTLMNSYNPIQDPFTPQSMGLSLPMTPLSALPFGQTELIISHNAQVMTEPLFNPAQSWIEASSFVRPDPTFSVERPQLDSVDAHKLIELFEDTNSLQERSKQKSRQQQLPWKKSKDAAWLRAVLVGRKQCVGANATAVAHGARLRVAEQAAKVEACAEHTEVASYAPLLAARKVPNVKVNVLHIHHKSAGLMPVQVLPGAEACAAGIKNRSCIFKLKPAN